MTHRRVAILTAVLFAACWARPVAGTTPPGPSKEMTQALKHYEAGRYHQASVLLHKVVDGGSTARKPTRLRAEFWLGRTLYHMGFYSSSLSFFDRIVHRGKSDKYYLPTLKWLVGLARKLPGPSGVTRKIGLYGRGVLTQRTLRALRDELRFYLGRHHYRQGAFKEAARLLAAVDPKSKLYLRARLLEGMVHVRLYKARPAAAAFKAVLRAAQGLTSLSSNERRQRRELAHISLARLFYSVGQHDKAIKYYGKIPRGTRHHVAARLEQSWAHFKAGAHRSALANLRALGAARAGIPESRYLEAAIYHRNCRYRRSLALARRYAARFKTLHGALLALLKVHKDPMDFHDHALKIRAGSFGLRGDVKQVVRSALDDPQLDKSLAHVKELDRELALVQSADPAWKAQAIAGVVLQDLTLQKSLAQLEAGNLARARISRAASELQRLIRQLGQVVKEAGVRAGKRAPKGCDRLKPRGG